MPVGRLDAPLRLRAGAYWRDDVVTPDRRLLGG